MKLYYPDSRLLFVHFFLRSRCPITEEIASRCGISQQCQCFYMASKFNALRYRMSLKQSVERKLP